MSDNEKQGAVEVPAVTQMGGTFAERKAAREKAEKPAAKAVQDAENKSVKTRRTARKG